jgi:hypothetical protein
VDATDKPTDCSKSHPDRLLGTAQAVAIKGRTSRTIQLLSPTNHVPAGVKITAEMQRQAYYDIVSNTCPIGYQPTPSKLMFGQMWERRRSDEKSPQDKIAEKLDAYRQAGMDEHGLNIYRFQMEREDRQREEQHVYIGGRRHRGTIVRRR